MFGLLGVERHVNCAAVMTMRAADLPAPPVVTRRVDRARRLRRFSVRRAGIVASNQLRSCGGHLQWKCRPLLSPVVSTLRGVAYRPVLSPDRPCQTAASIFAQSALCTACVQYNACCVPADDYLPSVTLWSRVFSPLPRRVELGAGRVFRSHL